MTINGEKVGSVIGGQVLPQHPDEEAFRKVAREIGVDEDSYIAALGKVNIRTEEQINASAVLLGEVLNNFINAEYSTKYNSILIEKLSNGVNQCEKLIDEIKANTQQLDAIQKKQEILSLNASIESARAGDVGKGFAVVANEFGKLSKDSKDVNLTIKSGVAEISEVIHEMTK